MFSNLPKKVFASSVTGKLHLRGGEPAFEVDALVCITVDGFYQRALTHALPGVSTVYSGVRNVIIKSH